MCRISTSRSFIGGKDYSSNVNVRLTVLCQHAFALGNERPTDLQQIEKMVWRMVLNVAVGHNAVEELGKLLQFSIPLVNIRDTEHIERNWFVAGMYAVHFSAIPFDFVVHRKSRVRPGAGGLLSGHQYGLHSGHQCGRTRGADR